MTPERWHLVRGILQRAMEIGPSERAAFLDRECAADFSLRESVDALLSIQAKLDPEFLESPAGEYLNLHSMSRAGKAILPMGTRLGPYEIEALIGEGGMGEVYRGRDTRLKRTVAIKVIPRAFSEDESRQKRFEREGLAIAALQHPNICTLHDVGQQDGLPYLVMEYLDGEKLSRRLSPGKPLSLDLLIRYGIEVSEALETAHRHGIVHRDIKPDNIIVTVHGESKVLDFGLAKLVDEQLAPSANDTDLTLSGVALGTVSYMSPEQARGEAPDARTDIFSLGVVLYEMATGVKAFSGATMAVVFRALFDDTPALPTELNPQLPKQVDVVVGRALEKDREKRYQSAGELSRELKLLKQDYELGMAQVQNRSPRDRDGRNKKEKLSATTLSIPAQPLRKRVRLRRLLTSIIGLAVLVMAVLLWRELRRVPVVSARGSMLIGNLINATSDALFDDTLEQALAIQLQQSPYLDIVSEQQVQTVLIEMGRSNGVRITGVLGREVCQRLNATLLLAGSIAALGHRYVVTLNAINCNTGGDVVREQDYSQGKEHILEAIGKLAANLRSKLGESSLSIAKFNAPLEQATTPSLDALKAFSQGIDLHDRKGDYAGSVPFFQRAIEIDPNFALAQLALAKAYNNVGKLDLARQCSIDAYAHRDRASERERLNITAFYYGYTTGDLEKAIQTSTLWAQTYPLDRDPHFQLLLAHAYLGNWDKSLSETKEILRLEPRSAVAYGNLVWIYTSLGRYDEAKATGEEALRKGLDSDLLRVNLYMLAFARNDAAGLTALADWSKAEHPLANIIVSSEADSAAYGGELKRARELTRRAVTLATSAHEPDLALAWQVDADLRDALLGDPNHTTDAHAKASSTPETEIRAGAVLSMALEPSITKTKAAANELEKHFPEDTLVQSVYLPVIRAQLELVQGHPQKAVELLQLTAPYELGQPNFIAVNPYAIYVRGEAYLAMRNGAVAQSEFQKILDHRGIVLNMPIGALAHLGLARSYALQQDIAHARTKYQDFLALWKNADPDISILKQAQSEYARLH